MTTQTTTLTLPEILELAGKKRVTAYLTLIYEPEDAQREIFAALRAACPGAVLAPGSMTHDLAMVITTPEMELQVLFDKRRIADGVRETTRPATVYLIGTEEFA